MQLIAYIKSLSPAAGDARDGGCRRRHRRPRSTPGATKTVTP